MTLAGILSAIWPLVRQKPNYNDQDSPVDDRFEGTRRVLIDQLDEIDRDRQRGLVNDEEATGARAEVGRSLLELERSKSEGVEYDTKSGRFYPWVSIVIIPILAVGAYHYLGSPNLPDQPIAARLAAPPETQNINLLVTQVEKHLETNADDIRGWQTLAPVYQRMNRLDDSENAFRKWLALSGEDKFSKGVAQSGLAQVLSIRNNGQVTGEAFELFEKSIKNAPENSTAFFFRAVGLTQQDKTSEAIPAWTALIERFGKDNPPWLNMAKNTLATLKSSGVSERVTSAPAPGPTAEQVEEAQQLSTGERTELIEGMVSRLADRLEESPDDLTGWNRLIQSYMVLGRKDQASDALKRALGYFSDNETAITALKETAKAQGL